MRIARYLSQCGVASRREAERMIAAGRVAVNGKVLTTPAVLVSDADRVEVDGRGVRPARLAYVLLNKPRGLVCTKRDPEGRPTVYSALPPQFASLPYVGRLDYNTTGLLLFTNDGDLAYRLERPEYRIRRVYEVKVRGRVRAEDGQKLVDGIIAPVDSGDGKAPPFAPRERPRGNERERGSSLRVSPMPRATAGKGRVETLRAEAVELVRYLSSSTVMSVVLTEGKTHEIKRLFEAIGHDVNTLERVEFAGLDARGLASGRWRELRPAEVHRLRKLVRLE